ncbi:MAG: hypothetical protein J0H01_15315 [Rhizobiales bacterium]|nr:hypothetical protein [Hyphomicrobiales bacterium]
MTAVARHDAAAGPQARDGAARLGAVDWLCLAAAPTFAVMALLTGVLGEPDILCSAARQGLLMGGQLGGMAPMYLLMSAFHLPPWLRLIAGRRGLALGLLKTGETI